MKASINRIDGQYLVPAVALEGEACTRETKSLVDTSLVKYGIAKKSSKIPSGGVGPS